MVEKTAILTGLVIAGAAFFLWRKDREMSGQSDSDIQKQHLLYQLRELQRLTNALIVAPYFRDLKYEDQHQIQNFNATVSIILQEMETKQ